MNKVMICGINTSTLPKLSEKEMSNLISRIKQGDSQAREQFIVANFRLVLSIMKRFSIKNFSSDDVFQAGCIGLIKAINNFDESFNVKFSTYAVPLIIGEIKKHIKSHNSLRISRSIRDTAYQVLKTRGELERNNEDASLEKIALKLKVALSEVVYALDAISDTVSLYDPVYSKNGDELLLVDKLGDEKNTEELWTENVALVSALERLEEREQKIIRLRYYEGKTQTEISEEVGISQAQVSRLEKTALKTLRDRIN